MKYTFRNVLFSWLLIAWTLLICRPCSARDIVLNEGFESGIPSTWTQEYVSGHQSWVTETVPFSYPESVCQGKSRAVLRNTSGQTQKFKTRLVTPEMNLKKIYRPLLRFAYANCKWAGDYDTLRVLYRTEVGQDWRLLAEATGAANTWKFLKADLPQYTSEHYQIAFEGSDALGRGIVLDSVIVCSAPECDVPRNVFYEDMKGDSVTLHWTLNYDAEQVRLVLSKVPIDPDTIIRVPKEQIALDTLFQDFVLSLRLQLEPGMRYCCYLQSVCYLEKSDWSEAYRFLMKASRPIPLQENFNTFFTKDTVTRYAEWTWGGTSNITPYIASNLTPEQCAFYSPDKTPHVAFTYGTPDDALRSMQYAYCVTPELTGADLKDCQVELEATVYRASGRKYAHSLIVGVMDHPDDLTNFTPVDTIDLQYAGAFYKHVISLASYTGTGRYVALLSWFSKPNLIYVDNLTIRERNPLTEGSSVQIFPHDTIDRLTWNTAGGVHLLPLEYDMEVKDNRIVRDGNTAYPLELGVFTNGIQYPHLSGESSFSDIVRKDGFMVPSTMAHSGHSSLYMQKEWGKDAWIVFPEVPDVKKTQLIFYLATMAKIGTARVAVGVMSDPFNLGTFDTTAVFTNDQQQFLRCYTHFGDYTGDGKYIAMLWDDQPDGSSYTLNFIDDIRLENLVDCRPPVWKSLKGGINQADLEWTGLAGNKYQVVLSTQQLAEEDMILLDHFSRFDYVAVDTIVTAAELHLNDLEWNTTYYCYVRTVCEDGRSEWATTERLSTFCPQAATLPYIENFDHPWNATCWTYLNYMMTDYCSTQFHYSGTKSLQLMAWSYTGQSVIAVAPKMDLDIHNLTVEGKTLRVLTTPYYAEDANFPELIVGVINADNEFFPYDTLYVYNEIHDLNYKWMDFRVDFADYRGPDGYIAFAQRDDAQFTTILLDDLRFSSNLCAAPYHIRTKAQADDGMTVTWRGNSSNGWQVQILSGADSTVVLRDTVVSGYEAAFGGLELDTKYYARVRPLCGEQPWSLDTVYTACSTIQLDKGAYFQDWESFPAGVYYDKKLIPHCWTTGVVQEDADTQLPFVKTESDSHSAMGGHKSLYLYSWTYPVWVASPEVECDDMSAVTIEFYHNCRRTEAFVFGMMSDPDDLSTFVPLDSIIGTNEYTLAVYDMAEYAHKTGSARYFAFRTCYNAFSMASIDNITIAKNACPTPRPLLYGLTESEVNFSTQLRNDNDWRLVVTNRKIQTEQLDLPGYTFPAGIEVVTDTLVRKGRGIRVTGLTPGRTYYFYVSVFCDSVHSAWQMASATTLCAERTPEQLGTIGFETDEGYTIGYGMPLPCWQTGSTTTGAEGTSFVPYVEGENTYIQNNALCIRTASDYTGAYAIMPPLLVEDIAQWEMNLYGYCVPMTGETTDKLLVGVISDLEDLSTMVVLDTLVGLTGIMQGYHVSFSDYVCDAFGRKGKSVIFYSPFEKNNYWYIDNISLVRHSSCPMPDHISVDTVGSDWAAMHWDGTADTYRIALSYTPVPDAQRSTYAYVKDTVVSGNSATLHGLMPTTAYYAYIQAVCGDTARSIFGIQYCSFATTSAPAYPLPFKDNFENSLHTGMGAHPEGWGTVYTAGSAFYPYIKTNSGNLNSRVLVFYSYDAVLSAACTPRLMVDNWHDIELSLLMRNDRNTPNALVVGLAADPDDIIGSFIPVDTLSTTSSTYESYTITFDRVDSLTAAKAKHVAFICNCKLNGQSFCYTYVDNVAVRKHPTCFSPEFSVTSDNEHSALVRITPAYGDDNKWQIAVLPDSLSVLIKNEQDINNLARIVTTDSVTTLVDSLDDGTVYRFWVHTLCNNDNFSEWSENLTVRTLFHYTDSWFFGFEKDELWVRSYKSSSDAYYIHPALQTGIRSGRADTYSGFPYCTINTGNANYAKTGNGAFTFGASTGGGYVIFPAIDDTVSSVRQFSFEARAGYANPATGELVNIPDAMELVLGTTQKGKGIETFQPICEIHGFTYPHQTAKASNNYLFDRYVLQLDPLTLQTRQIAIWHKPVGETVFNVAYFDNAQLTDAADFATPFITNTVPSDTTISVEWLNQGGPWELSLWQGLDTLVRTDTVYNASFFYSGLKPDTEYYVVLHTINSPQDGPAVADCVTSTTTLRPAHNPQADGKFVYTFDDDMEIIFPEQLDEDYDSEEPIWMKPVDWLSMNTCTYRDRPSFWHIEESTTDFCLGMNRSNALYVNTGKIDGTNFLTSYAVLPLLNCPHDSVMVSFYMRPFAEKSDGSFQAVPMRIAMPDKSLYSQTIDVGTISNPYDFNTFRILTQPEYPFGNFDKNTLVSDDPYQLNYWYKVEICLPVLDGMIAFAQSQPGFMYIDSLVIQPANGHIFTPYNLKAQCQTHSATLHWETGNAQYPARIEVIRIDGKDTVNIICDTITGCSCVVNQLQPSTEYRFRVQQMDGNRLGSFSPFVPFVTACAPINPNGYCHGFEDNGDMVHIEGTNDPSYRWTRCWTYNDALGQAWDANQPYNKANNSNYSYSRNGDYASFVSARYGSYQTYIALPAVTDIAAYDTLQLDFHIRPAVLEKETGKLSSQFTTNNGNPDYYSRSVIVGTCRDPYDLTTFIPIDTVNYTFAGGILTDDYTGTPANNMLYQHVSVPLKGARGEHAYIMSTLFAKGSGIRSEADIMYIDDISFQVLNDCFVPQNLLVTNMLLHSADIRWETTGHPQSTVVEVSRDFLFGSIALRDTAEGNSHTIQGLESGREYYVRLKSLCDDIDAESGWSEVMSFRTPNEPYYIEDFRHGELGQEWTGSNTPAEEAFNGQTLGGVNNLQYGWQGVMGKGAWHYAAPLTDTDPEHRCNWIISPPIHLTEGKNAHLTFNIALGGYGGGVITDEANGSMGEGDVFMLAVMDVAESALKRENVHIWNNGRKYGDPYEQMNQLTEAYRTIRIDLRDYAGKTVRIGFYCESGEQPHTVKGSIHIGQIRVHYYSLNEQNFTLCQYEDIDAYGWHIDGESTLPGHSTYERCVWAGETEALYMGAIDSVFHVEATYLETPVVTFSDENCGGHVYSNYGFSGQEMNSSGIYKRKLISAVTGCDSIVVVNLNLIEPVTGPIERDTLINNATLTWHNRTISAPGFYSDTIPSLSTGCDSICHVEIVRSEFSALESVNRGAERGIYKIIYRDRLYIVRDGEWYNALGIITNEQR